jgi:uncharacterized protein
LECKLIIALRVIFVNIQNITILLQFGERGLLYALLIHRLFFYVGGLAILTLGASMTIKADLGAGPWDSLNVGLTNLLGLTVGGWSVIIGLLLILLNAVIAKKIPEVSCAITVAISGIFIDAWLLLVFDSYVLVGFYSKIINLSIGILLISLGIATYIQARWPLSPIDDFMIALKDRYKITVGTAKTIGEVLALCFAVLLHGPIGLGTFVVALGLGPFIAVFNKMWERMLVKR